MIQRKRKKAWAGAAMSAVGMAADIANSFIQANQQRKAYRRQQREQNRIDTLQGAQNLSAAYSDQSYLDDFTKKVEFKAGGKKRHKASLGINENTDTGNANGTGMGTNTDGNNSGNNTWNSSDTESVIAAGLSAIGKLGASAILSAKGNKNVVQSYVPSMDAKTQLKYAKMGCAFKRK